MKNKIIAVIIISMMFSVLGSSSTKAAGIDVKNYIKNEIYKHKSTIKLDQFDLESEQLKVLMKEVLIENPELYYVNNIYTYNAIRDNVLDISIDYYYEKSEIYNTQRQIESVVAKVKNSINDEMDDIEKARIIHDYLIDLCEYDYEGIEQDNIEKDDFTIYGTLINRKGVCLGYAKAFLYIFSMVSDSECYIITSDKMNHAWNGIAVDGNIYHIDVTRDECGSTDEKISYEAFIMDDDKALDFGYSDWSIAKR